MKQEELEFLVDKATTAVIDLIPDDEYYDLSGDEQDVLTTSVRAKILEAMIIFQE